MKKVKNRKRRFKLLPGSILYFSLLIYAVFLTQLLRNAVSGALFMFVLVLPVFSFIYCLIGKSAIQVYISSEKQRTEKYEPLDYEIKIINTSFLAFPFVEAVISEPGENAVRCTKKKFILSLVSFGSYNVKNTVKFRYRGFYEIGVDSLYISDLLRFFAIRTDMENYAAVSVFPRKMTIVGRRNRSVTDVPSSVIKRNLISEKNEVTDIRDYIPGDSVRDIHWKLSSKTQDLMVKQYSSVEDRHVYILCDMARALMAPKKEDSYGEYDRLKKYVKAEFEEDKNKRLRRSVKASKNEAEDKLSEIEEVAERDADGLFDNISKKRSEAKYSKNIKSGMSEKDAETIRSIDELIRSNSKSSKKKKDKKSSESIGKDAGVSAAENDNVSLAESDLNRILKMSKIPQVLPDDAERIYGGRVRKDMIEDYDEFCFDAVVEMTLAEVLSELKEGNICTVAWYDANSERGIQSYTLSSPADFENILVKLAVAGGVQHESFVANLGTLISESTNVTVKVVTSNIDPQSAAEISELPARFGGAGTGCSVEVVIFSPIEKYEDPSLRAVYTSDVAADFKRRGMTTVTLSESVSGDGAPVFVPIS